MTNDILSQIAAAHLRSGAAVLDTSPELGFPKQMISINSTRNKLLRGLRG